MCVIGASCVLEYEKASSPTRWRPLEWDSKDRRVAWPAGAVEESRDGRRADRGASYLFVLKRVV